jgi:hypothetical protein
MGRVLDAFLAVGPILRDGSLADGQAMDEIRMVDDEAYVYVST